MPLNQLPVPSKQSTEEKPSSMLWEFQLRRENKALLDEIREQGKKADAAASDYMKRFEEGEKRRQALESKVADLEREQKKYQSLAAAHQKECAEELAKVEEFLRGRVSEDELRQIMASPPTPTPVRTSAPPAARPQLTMIPQTPVIKPRPAAVNLPGPGPEHTATKKVAIAEPSRIPTTKPRQVANRRPSTRSRSQAADIVEKAPPVPPKNNIPAKTASVIPSSLVIPRLAQKHKSLMAYYKLADQLFHNLDNPTRQDGYDFIHAFITGLGTKSNVDKVMKAMMAVHPAKGRLSGGIEILCSWDDVADGFKRAGLDVFETRDMAQAAKEEMKKKKRTFNVRTQLETGLKM